MSTAYLVLLILLVIYIPIYVWVWKNPEKADRLHLQKYGPALMIKTHLGMKTMDRLSKYRRFWRVFGFVSKLISAILLFLMMYMMVVAIINLPGRIGSSSIGIEYALAIPGFNPILPLSYGIVALLIAMVVHEMGHGIQTRANDAKVDSTGLLYGVIPLGAFVEPNEAEMSEKPRRVQMDMYTAGISVNTFVAIGCIAAMIFACGFVSSPYDDNVGVYSVDKDSPGNIAGIPSAAIITGIYDSEDVGMEHPLDYTISGAGLAVSIVSDEIGPDRTYTITYDHKDESKTVQDVTLGTFIKTVTNNSPASDAGMKPGEIMYSIDFGEGPVIINNPLEFTGLMEQHSPGEEVTITTMTVTQDPDTGVSERTINTPYTVTLGDKNGHAYLGVSSNTSGMMLTTPDILMDRATDPFYGCTDAYSYVQGIFSYLSGPFNGMDPISDEVKWWYDAPMGELFWIIVTLLYWVFWLDLLLAISNALPAYPFDGGFIFAGGVSWLLERIGIRDEERRQRIGDSISSSVSTITLFMFMLVIVSFLI